MRTNGGSKGTDGSRSHASLQGIQIRWNTVAPVGSGGPSKRLGARQVALSCDPIILFEGVPDLVLTFTILCSGQSSCDQVRSWYHVELRPHLGVKIHKLANLEFVFSHAAPRDLHMLARPRTPAQVSDCDRSPASERGCRLPPTSPAAGGHRIEGVPYAIQSQKHCRASADAW